MAKTLYIGDEMKVLFGEQDFVDLIEEKLGEDAREYLEDIINERDRALKDCATAIDDANYYVGVACEAEEKAWKYDQLCK